MALSLPHLTALDLNGCSALRGLELRCPALRSLNLQVSFREGPRGRGGSAGWAAAAESKLRAPKHALRLSFLSSLQACCSLPVECLQPLLRGLAGDGRGGGTLTLLDGQHAGPFGEALAAAVAAAKGPAPRSDSRTDLAIDGNASQGGLAAMEADGSGAAEAAAAAVEVAAAVRALPSGAQVLLCDAGTCPVCSAGGGRRWHRRVAVLTGAAGCGM